MLKLFFILLFFISAPVVIASQDTIDGKMDNLIYDSETTLYPVDLDPDKINSYKEDSAFNYLTEVTNDSWWTRFKRWVGMRYRQLLEYLFQDYQANSILAFFLRILPYIIIGLVIGFIIWLFIRLNPGQSILGTPEGGQVYSNEEENLIKSTDISGFIEKAINDGNYRLAVRYYYLQLLKQLNEKGIIDYEYQKTNSEYLSQINEDAVRQPVKRLMRIYDYIWYGSFEVLPDDFSLAQKAFQDMESTVLKSSNEK